MIPHEELAAMRERSYCPDVVRLLAEVERLRGVAEAAKYFRTAMRTPLKTGNERFDAQDDLFAALDAAEGTK